MPRHQDGTIILRSNQFYVRYTEGDKRPIAFLAAKDADHWTRRRKNKLELSEKLEAIREKVMRQVNERHGAHSSTNISSTTIGEFWDESFVPSWKDRELHASTTAGYSKTWSLYLEDHLSKRKLIDYRTPDASKFLTSLVTEKKLGRNTLAHCRALMSNVFAHAKNHGLIASNPIHDVKIMAKVRAPKATECYTLPEALLILKALESRLDAQCIFGLAFFLGLRPSEIAGMKFEDITSDGRLHVRRAVVNGVEGATKTEKATERLLLIEPVRSLLEAWKARCGSPAKGWLFPSQRGGPLNVESFCRNALMPLVKAAGLPYRALYAARRGTGTILRDLSGNLIAAQQVLRHESLETTDHHYALPSVEQADKGLRLMETAFLNATKS
jgi:integrase